MDYLTTKWTLWFHSLDVNHDGKISFEDVEEPRNQFTDLHKLLGEKASGVKVDMEKWWNTCIFKASTGRELSEPDFISYLRNSYNKDKAAFTNEMNECFDMIFDDIDTNKDREMEYLTGKWQTWYKSLDVNHDGTVSMADVEESRNKFTELHHLPRDKAQGVKMDMETWWKTYVFRSYGDEVSMAQFVQGLKDSLNKDKAAFKKEMSDCFNMIFDVIDTNKDRSIKLQEFIFAFKAFGHGNQKIIKKAFELLKPKDGLVPLRDVVNAWISFVCETDSSKADVIKQAFDAGF